MVSGIRAFRRARGIIFESLAVVLSILESLAKFLGIRAVRGARWFGHFGKSCQGFGYSGGLRGPRYHF
jgi:hypothetical protein